MVSKGFSASFEFQAPNPILGISAAPGISSVRHPVDFPKHTEATSASHYDA